MTREEYKNLIKRYLLEQGYNNGYVRKLDMSDENYQTLMYQKLKIGEISIDSRDFEKWLDEYQKNNHQFAQLLKLINMNMESSIVELSETSCYSITGLKEFPFNKSTTILTRPGNDNCTNCTCFRGLNENNHLLCNGVYPNELIYLSKFSINGSFSVGVYGDPNNEYTQEELRYYRCLKANLLQMLDGKIGEIREPSEGKEAYILVYEKEKNRQNNIFEHKISQR